MEYTQIRQIIKEIEADVNVSMLEKPFFLFAANIFGSLHKSIGGVKIHVIK